MPLLLPPKMNSKYECRKFSPNMFNKSKCQHCFGGKDVHSAEALENNRACRKVSKCGYLFVAPDWDFSNQIYRTKRWQRRWFVLYDDGELTYAVDEHPDTVPQGTVDMGKVLEVSDAEEVTGNEHSLAITAPDKVHFVKGTCKEESKWWFDVLSVYPRFVKGRQRRNATFPGIKGPSAHPQIVTAGQRDAVIRPRFHSCRAESFDEERVNVADAGRASPVPSPPLPRLVPATPTSGRDSGVAVTVRSPDERGDVTSKQKGPSVDNALTLILADSGPGLSRRSPRRLRRRSPETERNEVNRSLYVTVPDFHPSTEAPSTADGTGRSPGDEGPRVVSWTEKVPFEATFKEHTVRGDPDGCGLDHGVKCNIPEIRVDDSAADASRPGRGSGPANGVQERDTPIVKKGWLMRKEESKDWLKRWFVLCGPTLRQYADPVAESSAADELAVDMDRVRQVRESEVARNYGIEITLCDGSTVVVSALTATLRAGWVQALRDATLRRDGETDEDEKTATRRTVLGSDRQKWTSPAEETSSRAVPSSPPLNRTVISRVKERARHKAVPRTVGAASKEACPEDDVPGNSGDGGARGAYRGRDPTRRHTLPARTVNVDMWTPSDALPGAESGKADMLRKWTRIIESRHGTPGGQEFAEKRKAKILRLKSVSDLTEGARSEPASGDEWAGRCEELKGKLEAAVKEIKELKAQLKKSQDNADDLELRCFRLDGDRGESEKRHRDEVALLSLRIQDLATKLANAERQLRAPTVRRPRSLRGRESVSVSRELEMKVEDLEGRLASVEGNLGGGVEDRGGGGYEGTARLSRSSSFTSVTESLAIHSKLREMDARLDRAAKRVRSKAEDSRTGRRWPTSSTLSGLRRRLLEAEPEKRFAEEATALMELAASAGKESGDDEEEVARLRASLQRSVKCLRDGLSASPSPLSAFWEVEGAKEEEDGLVELAEQEIRTRSKTLSGAGSARVMDFLRRGVRMTLAEAVAARLLATVLAGSSPDAGNSTMRMAEERLKALREEMGRLSRDELVEDGRGEEDADRLAGVMIAKALLTAHSRVVGKRDGPPSGGIAEEVEALATVEPKLGHSSALTRLLTAGYEDPPPTVCLRCEELATRVSEMTANEKDGQEKARDPPDPSKEAEQRATVTRLEEEVVNLRNQLRSMVDDYEQHVTALKETFEQELSRRSEMRVGAASVHHKYQSEMEQLKSLCEKGMAAIDHSHRRILVGLEEKHRREMEHVRAEKEQALAEETQATLAALDAMRKAHETELQREVAKFKEEYLSKMHASSDLEALRREHEEEMESIKREILFLSRKYSLKCLDGASLEERVELQGRQIREANELIFDLTARNKQLRAHLKKNIRELQHLTKDMENSGHKRNVQELQLQLQLKENQLAERAERMADLERQVVEAKNHHKALEQQCQALDASLRANGRALGDEVNGLKARLERVILAGLPAAEGQVPPPKDRAQHLAESKRAAVATPTRHGRGEFSPRRRPCNAVGEMSEDGVVASRKRLFEDPGPRRPS